ncbi:hypothetical protein GH714_010775 [Hevea brasiliensis]|uniref:Disease resistance protein At4g27190-like leucine-rich repeats domain-containing protein n=1 Tax=Hevea brasiliensis TaxID=3981 RepID=A0A6A6N2B3_HEVBR|nr:hypothetical protein GH714_010775 [Hevea brasiliensis]
MIKLLIDVGVIEGESRREEFNEGHTMLNKLLNLCLLEECTYRSEMHNLLKNMAIQIMNADARVIVKNGEKLSEMPEWGNWSEDLVRISLSYNDIRKIPSGYSPSCPNLSTVLLGNNGNLSFIGNSFFKQLHGLKMLDLSWTAIEKLPTSISHLVNLSALLLRECIKLRRVPSLAGLRALKKLDLYGSGVEKVPKGIKLLSNLRYLDLCGTNIEELQPGILPKLSQLRFLRLGFSFTVEGKEVASLRKLEKLECGFHDVGELNAFMTCKPSTSQMRWRLFVGQSKDMVTDYVEVNYFGVYFNNCSISEGGNALSLPKDVKSLVFNECNIESHSLCLENAIELEYFEIGDCEGLECLFSLSSSHSVFENLEIIKIRNLKDLYFLFGEGGRNFNGDIPLTVPFSLPHGTFSLLKNFKICNCPSMKKLFPQSLMSNLQNLEVISVADCDNMEELIASEEGQESYNCNNGNSFIFTLPKLRMVKLVALPELKSICSGEIVCDSLQIIEICNCPSMKKLFPQGLMSNLQNLEEISVGNCNNMEELIASEEGQESYNCNNGNSFIFTLPKLRMVKLVDLPELKSICSGEIVCDSLQIIEICNCPSMKKLFPQGLMSNLQNLEEISVGNCNNMEELIALEEGQESYNCNNGNSFIFTLPKLRMVKLFDLPELKSICSGEIVCDSLQIIEISNCPSMKKLFPQSLMSNLQNLEVISVTNCDNMEELIASEEGQESYNCNNGNSFIFTLPKLRMVKLFDLPELKSICSGEIVCDSLETIKVWNCLKLERIALSLFLRDHSQLSPLPSLRAIIIYPRASWELIEFDHSDAKNVLLHLCLFPGRENYLSHFCQKLYSYDIL